MRKIVYLLLTLPLVMLIACDAEFDPNDDWQEKMMIYCLLDQDDDTTYVRVERCFLGNGNAHEFAKNKDSIYYAPDELDVKLYAYNIWDTSTVVAVYDFLYTTRAKNNGEFFFNTNCPVYYCTTKGRLSTNQLYQLVVTNMKTGKQANAKTLLLGNYTIETTSFTFTEDKGTMGIVWSNLHSYEQSSMESIAKQFAVSIRFNYTEGGIIKYIDIPVASKVNNNIRFSMKTAVDTASIFSGMRTKLKGKTNLNWYGVSPFEIKVSAGDLSLFDYISINSASNNSLNYTPIYTNIDGGIGLFAARRTHIHKSFADKEISNDIKEKIKTFGFGF
ncbi:MAG: DUF4249 family protein [Bacteroidales bacterium]